MEIPKPKSYITTSVLILFTYVLAAQSIKGVVLDFKTNEPIETASVYFDNTTIGTTTNANGEFEIELRAGITSSLIISYLGYEKMILESYESSKFYKVLLTEATNVLDEVVISYDDGMSRKQKLKHFRREFLGFSKHSKSCKILNEDDIILKYDKERMRLTASAIAPLKVKNNSLQYIIYFDIIDFVIQFGYELVTNNKHSVKIVAYTGTTFYESIEDIDRKTVQRRNEVFKGSILHFMRALSKKRLEEEGFDIYRKQLRVEPYDYFNVKALDKQEGYVSVKLLKKVDILYNKKYRSVIQSNVDKFIINPYGSHSPLTKVLFGGVMGNQRVGDLLPIDYELSE
ncbi:carboxypeptidase-like regulatory domain-containing protein [uncultured Psychroserpens sp.]|uniref:carboxypeptidase-like regulatory domain-containing protein n=1 Tax=uncultured Psychroserpens sp. TaxID=255436 RepID=UPI002621A819|nr:carboxypeptidase-like regulatory domain-containing protein [uncultured Psychroserpens sp.]